MKPTKNRNQQIYQASNKIRSKQIGSTLSEGLRKKYGKRNARVIPGDSVKVMRGEYKGVDGKVTKVSIEKNSVAIEGIKKEKMKGDKIDVYINSSNVIITNLNTDDNWRKYKLEGDNPKIKKTQKVVTEKKETKTETVEKKEIDIKKENSKKNKEGN